MGIGDHARVLLPWNHFPEDYPERMRQEADPEIEYIYRTLIALRKGDPALIYGNFRLLDGRKDHFTYMRRSRNRIYVIDCNLSAEPRKTRFRGEEQGYEIVFAPELLGKRTQRRKMAEQAARGMAETLTGAANAGADGKRPAEGAANVAETDLTGEPLPIFGGNGPEEIAAQILKRYVEENSGKNGREDELLEPYEARIWRKEIR